MKLINVALVFSLLILGNCAGLREEIAISVDEEAPDPFGGQSGDIPDRPGIIEQRTGKKLEKVIGF